MIDKYINYTYYSFNDALVSLNIGWTNGEVRFNPKTFVSLKSALMTKYNFDVQSSGYTTYFDTLLYNLFNRYKNHAVGKFTDEEIEAVGSNTYNLFESFFANLLDIMYLTFDKYSELITYYNAAKTKLMDQIKSTSTNTTRFNDTPQNGGSYSDDNHTSNFSEYESNSAVDGDTKVQRLDEINKKYHNIMLEWCNEFDRLFLEEEC